MRLLFVQFLIATTLLSGCKTDGADSDITSSIKADNVAGESEGSSKLIDQTAKAAAEPSIEDSLTLAVEPFAQSYRPPKLGTVYTYHNNWASLPKVIKYKVSGPARFAIGLFTLIFWTVIRLWIFYDTADGPTLQACDCQLLLDALGIVVAYH